MPHHRQFPEWVRLRQLAAQRLVPSDWPLALLVALLVGVEQPGPYVAGRP